MVAEEWSTAGSQCKVERAVKENTSTVFRGLHKVPQNVFKCTGVSLLRDSLPKSRNACSLQANVFSP